jgi:soluble lytic murein transglycosylase-like protein
LVRFLITLSSARSTPSGWTYLTVEKAAETLAVDAQLLFALIRVESQFNRYAMSPKGALCYTQIMPNWHATALLDNIKRFRAQSIYDPEVCIITGAKILKEFIAEQGGNVERGLLRYNGSLNDPDKTYARKVFQEKARVQSIVGRE